MHLGIRNATVTVPPGSRNPSPDVLCFPAGWDDIALFIVANYIAHAASTIINQGSGIVGIAYAIAKALFFPAASAIYGSDAIASGAIFSATDLEKAVRAGAVLTKRAEGGNYKHRDVLYNQATPRTNPPWFFAGFFGHTPDKTQRFRLAMTTHIGLWCPKHCGKIRGAECNQTCPHHPNCAADSGPTHRKCNHRCTHHCSPGAEVHELCHLHCPGTPDAGTGDAGTGDAGTPDAGSGVRVELRELSRLRCPGTRDAGTRDAGTRDAGTRDAGAGGAGAPDAGKNSNCNNCVRHCPPPNFTDSCPRRAQQESAGCPRHCTQELKLSYSYDGLKAVIAIFQLGFAITTVVRTAIRGNQLTRYGYAAFGLTVIPYGIMSFVHLLGALIRPRFFKMYFLDGVRLMHDTSRDAVLDENGAIQLSVNTQNSGNQMSSIQMSATTTWLGVWKWKVYGYIHRAWAVMKSRLHLGSKKWPQWLNPIILSSLVVVVSIAIIAGTTRFDPGESTAFQRGATMSWLVSGIPVAFLDSSYWKCEDESSAFRWTWFRRGFILLLVAAPLCGFVAVGNMLMEYGVCIRI